MAAPLNPDGAALLATGRRVIETERAGLEALGVSLNDSFVQAAEMILAAQGRVIVSGMGKSGHIARKLAATFASTGTPAHFVHPAEASHGDLGMMTPGDVVVLLSNSGETPELADMIAYTRRFSIPLIGVASRAGSTLLDRADLAILLPTVEEACTTGKVPTTSTTMTLALGDALAVALMEHRQFTPAMFREFHPGGTLGAQLARVGDLMHSGADLPLVTESEGMDVALLAMTEKGLGVVGVIDDQACLTGIITDGDLRRNMTGLLDRCAADVMTANPKTISPSALAAEAVAQMNARKITCLFVTDPEQGAVPLGVVKLQDCLRAGVV